MEKYDKLVKALRICSSELNCGDCPLLYRDSCSSDELMADAAAAIEELSKTVKDLTTKVECSPMQISGKAFDRAIEAWNEKARKAVQE